MRSGRSRANNPTHRALRVGSLGWILSLRRPSFRFPPPVVQDITSAGAPESLGLHRPLSSRLVRQALSVGLQVELLPRRSRAVSAALITSIVDTAGLGHGENLRCGGGLESSPHGGLPGLPPLLTDYSSQAAAGRTCLRRSPCRSCDGRERVSPAPRPCPAVSGKPTSVLEPSAQSKASLSSNRASGPLGKARIELRPESWQFDKRIARDIPLEQTIATTFILVECLCDGAEGQVLSRNRRQVRDPVRLRTTNAKLGFACEYVACGKGSATMGELPHHHDRRRVQRSL